MTAFVGSQWDGPFWHRPRCGARDIRVERYCADTWRQTKGDATRMVTHLRWRVICCAALNKPNASVGTLDDCHVICVSIRYALAVSAHSQDGSGVYPDLGGFYKFEPLVGMGQRV